MAPPLPPGLMDDVIGEILLRLPPSDPACLVRASLVCKSWRSLVLDRAFLRQYRGFHRTAAPVLGFFHDQQYLFGYNDDIFVPRFVPTTTMRAPPAALPEPAASAGPMVVTARADPYSCRIVDCRHGRVLFHTEHVLQLEPSPSTLTVWDPITGHHRSFSPPPDIDPYHEFMGAVLCSASNVNGGGGCDHLECSTVGGPFLVVIAGVSYGVNFDEAGVTWARVYSSETAAWVAPPTLDVDPIVDCGLPSLLAAGAVYFMLDDGCKLLKCDLLAGAGAGEAAALSVMKAPPKHQHEKFPNRVFATTRDDELGVAIVDGYSLHLWSWVDDVVGEWTRVRVIELEPIIPISMGDPSTEFDLAGSAQGAGLIFISPNDEQLSIFTVELKSGHITKTRNTRNYGKIFPLITFCTPGLVVRSRSTS